MTQINFYHLTKTPLDKALPKLLEKAVQKSIRTLVIAENEQRVEELNNVFWTYTTKFFLPHGSRKDGHSARQPVYLTHDNDNPNNAELLVIAENAPVNNVDSFARCLYMFDGNDENQLSVARNRWKEFKAKGFELTYWQQNAKGTWEEGSK